MKFLSKGLLWKKGPPDIYGQPTYGKPIVIQHRWEQKNGVFITREGRTQGYSSRIYIDVYADAGDRIAKRVTDSIDNSYEIKDARAISNVSGSKTEYRVVL
jgi:hypothetical protein